MRQILTSASIMVFAATVPFLPSTAGAASGTPQRSDEIPPGLEKVFLKGNPGITRALIATEGSNSRLQELPVSP